MMIESKNASVQMIGELEQVEKDLARIIDELVQHGIVDMAARRIDVLASTIFIQATRLMQFSSNREAEARVRKGLGLTD